jgi:hypothetical protein
MFQLHKWFADCVTSDGEAVVVYLATLRWGLLRLSLASVLRHRDGTTTTRTRLGRWPAPTGGDDERAIAVPRLGVRGSWRGRVRSEARELWRSPHGAVTWSCQLPQARVELELGGERIAGTGYVEHLALDVAPWRLPIDELRWGRWHGAGSSLVWIQWRGAQPLRLCLRDGEAIACGEIGDDGFTFANGERLALANTSTLRDGRLGRTVLARGLLRLLPLPRAVRAMHETKWLAAGTLTAPGTSTPPANGFALHEVVRWA